MQGFREYLILDSRTTKWGKSWVILERRKERVVGSSQTLRRGQTDAAEKRGVGHEKSGLSISLHTSCCCCFVLSGPSSIIGYSGRPRVLLGWRGKVRDRRAGRRPANESTAVRSVVVVLGCYRE